MNKLFRNLLLAGFLASASALAATEEKAAEPAKAEAEKGLVVTTEGLPERCILPLILTSVDGEEVDEASTGRFELDPGPHTFGGYATEGTDQCATFTGENPVAIEKGAQIGESTTTVDVVSKKEYYLGVDVRSKDKSKWKIVTWKIKH